MRGINQNNWTNTSQLPDRGGWLERRQREMGFVDEELWVADIGAYMSSLD